MEGEIVSGCVFVDEFLDDLENRGLVLDEPWVSEPGEEIYDPEEDYPIWWSGEEWTVRPDSYKYELVWNGTTISSVTTLTFLTCLSLSPLTSL